VLRAVLRVALVGALAAWVADRLLARRNDDTVPPVHMLVVVDAPIERTWDVLADIPRQPEWMADMKAVRMTTPEPTVAGSRGEAVVRILGIAVEDPVEVVEFDPPRRFAVRHEGTFKGGGVMELEAGVDGTTTIVRWAETLVAPALPHLAAVVGAPVLRRVFQDDLFRLKRLVETEAA
jgi:uncharacterized membrane protein